MRETPRSLRLYFFLVGLIATLSCMVMMGIAGPEPGALFVIFLLQGVWGVGYLYLALKLPVLLREKPQLPIRFAAAAIVFSCLSMNLLTIGLNVYILYQLRRLAKEAGPEMESQVLD